MAKLLDKTDVELIKKLSAKQLSEIRKLRRQQYLSDICKKFLGLLPYIALIYFGSQAVISFAGEDTSGSFSVITNIVADLKMDKWFAYAFGIIGGGGGTIYGFRVRKLGKKIHGHYADRIKELEEKVDPDRSSSHLTNDGETNPRD